VLGFVVGSAWGWVSSCVGGGVGGYFVGYGCFCEVEVLCNITLHRN